MTKLEILRDIRDLKWHKQTLTAMLEQPDLNHWEFCQIQLDLEDIEIEMLALREKYNKTRRYT